MRTPLRCAITLAVFSCVCASLAGQAGAARVSVESSRWGFDGNFVTQRFNLLTLHIRNDGQVPFEGSVRLTRMGLGPEGAPQVAPCFLGPGSRRRVQFYPFVAHGHEEWLVRVRDFRMEFSAQGRDNTPKFQRIQQGSPAMVLMEKEGTLLDRQTGLTVFPEQDFPTSVTGTSCLGSVVLDHVPDLQPAQETALVDWVRGGGTLRLFHRAAAHTSFTGALTVLNDPADRFFVGQGVVERHARALTRNDPMRSLAPRGRAGRAPTSNGTRNVATQVLDGLVQIVRPDHNWALIYFVVFLFFIAVVPWHAFLAYRKMHYLGSIGTLLAIVAVCTWVLFFIGSRGYDESSAVNTISYAKVLKDGRYDVTQFIDIFSTSSQRIAVRHEAEGSVYAAVRSDEVPGRILVGPDRGFDVAVPLFTTRPFVHRGVFAGDALGAKVARWNERDPLGEILIEWKGPAALRAHAFHRRQVVDLQLSDGVLLSGSGSRRRREFFAENSPQLLWPRGYQRQFEPGVDPRRVLDWALPGIIADRWGVSDANVEANSTDENTIRLVVVCEGPDWLKMGEPGSARRADEQGFVIFDVLLRKPL